MKAPLGMSSMLLVVLLLGGCSGDDDESAPVGAAALPADLCAAVPDDIVDRWQLTEATHETTGESVTAVATCDMTGRYQGGAVTVALRLESYGGADSSAARDTMMAELADQCADLEQSARGRFVDDENDCTDTVESGRSSSNAQVVQVARAFPVFGISRVEMSHDGPGASLVGAEVEGLTGVLTTTEPDELG